MDPLPSASTERGSLKWQTHWLANLHAPDNPSSLLEEAWFLGSPETVRPWVEAFAETIKKRFLLDPCLAQVWWKGQVVGMSVELVNDRSILQKNMPLAEAVDAHLFSVFQTPALEKPKVRLASPGAACHEWFDADGVTENFEAIRLVHQRLMASGGPLDRNLVSPAPFEVLAMADDLEPFRKELAKTVWDAQAIEAWWRCSSNWLHRRECVPDVHGRLGRRFNSDGFHQMAVLDALACALPKNLLDTDRACALAKAALGPTNPVYWNNSQAINTQWLRTLIGQEAAWDVLGARVSLTNQQAEETLSWFRILPEHRQRQALEQALEEPRYLLAQGVALENQPVAQHVTTLHRHCPSWEGWLPYLEQASKSNRINLSVLALFHRLQAQAKGEHLDEVLPAGDVSMRPRPRM